MKRSERRERKRTEDEWKTLKRTVNLIKEEEKEESKEEKKKTILKSKTGEETGGREN